MIVNIGRCVCNIADFGYAYTKPEGYYIGENHWDYEKQQSTVKFRVGNAEWTNFV